MTKAALLVLSGGQDSTTAGFWAKQHFDEIHAVTFDYGQRHSLEIDAAGEVAELMGVTSHEIINLGSILKGKSPLTDPDEPLEQYADFAAMDQVIGNRIELTWVPMRNALFLTIAANRACCLGIDDIVAGMCQLDQTNYPDCRPGFVTSQAMTICCALGLNIATFHIHTPLMNVNKHESIRMAMHMKGAYPALAWTHTAYDNAYPPTGKDHATVLRAYGFEQAGVPDPLIMRAVREGLLTLPEASNYTPSAVAEYEHVMERGHY